jgi:hypothetical protein
MLTLQNVRSAVPRFRFPQNWRFRFWVMVPCSFVGGYLCSGGICRLKLQARSENEGNKFSQMYRRFHLPPMRIYRVITQLLIYTWPSNYHKLQNCKNTPIPKHKDNKYTTSKQTPWLKSMSELYQPSDSRLSAKLVPTIPDRGLSRGQHGRSLWPYSRFSRLDYMVLPPSATETP